LVRVVALCGHYYGFYGLGFVFTSLYPLYLALMGLSAYSLLGLLANIDLKAFRAAIADQMPVRLISVVLGMTALFIPIWLSMIVQRIGSQQAQATDLVFVFDLPYLIPACLLAAVWIWQRRTLGYLLAGPLIFKATVSGALLTGGELLKLTLGLPLAPDQLSLYLFLMTVGGFGLLSYLRNVARRKEAHFNRPAVRPPFGEEI
jgi:hypothetical protein